MKREEWAIVLIIIVILIALIVDKVEKDAILSDLSKEQAQLSVQVNVNDIIIAEMKTEQVAINNQLKEWSTIDQRWLGWLEDNWSLVKSLGEANEP